jgi:hypothetical protein
VICFCCTESSTGIGSLLSACGLGGLAPRFEAEEVTAALLPLIGDEALAGLGVKTLGARVRLQLAAQRFRRAACVAL